MANQRNFISNIAELSLNNTKFTVSRIIDDPRVNPLFEIEVPSEFLEFDKEYTVEMNLYSLADNSLVYSEVLSNNSVSSPIQVQKFMYSSGMRTLVFIDFSTIGVNSLPIGKYRVSFNFFANELGTSANSRRLRISKISPTRREVEVKFSPVAKDDNIIINKFASPTVRINDAFDMFKQVFNQSGSQDLNLTMYTSSIDRSRIESVLGISASQTITKYNFDIDGDEPNTADQYRSKLGLYTLAQNILDNAYKIASNSLSDAVYIHKSESLTLELLTGSVQYAISQSYSIMEQDEETNPNKYRFDLI